MIYADLHFSLAVILRVFMKINIVITPEFWHMNLITDNNENILFEILILSYDSSLE